MDIKVYPSLLSADLLNMERSIEIVKDLSDALHVDIMDGHFVPNLSYGPSLVKALRNRYSIPLNVHLMVEKPENFVDMFIEAGASHLGFHVEATHHPQRLLKYIRDHNIRPFITLNPATPLNTIEYLLGELDMVLIMTVNPGYGGQEFLHFSLKKIKSLREMAVKEGINLDIMVDGGIDLHTAPLVIEAGANVLISGNSIFNSENPREVIIKMKSIRYKEV
ncbi:MULTISPECIES: ribulose-phosphate 3-epimerase [Dictyoglomus]|jgi:ribulose-phosphate 3-epimerase|uniref:ribulose-phosphate 3-epimerase n=1 Tax=Dictyoglomus TaxID=13 RepID=UPI003C78DACA